MKEEQLLLDAVDSLPEGFLLQYEISHMNGIHDGLAKLVGPMGEFFEFILEVKLIHRKESLMTVREKIFYHSTNCPILLVCNRLTPALITYCTENQINFIDTSGNVRIQVPGLYLFADGKYVKKTVNVSNHFAEGVMKLLFVLLSSPEYLSDTYRELAEKAGISLGMVSKAFNQLEARRYFRQSQKGRRLMNEDELKVLWLKDYAISLRQKLSIFPLLMPASLSEIELKHGEYWSGEIVAKELSGGYLIPEGGVIFTPYSFLQRRKELGLKPAPNGKLQLISCFWGSFILNSQAKVMLCVAELLASGDDRNIETARIINDRYLNIKESDLFGY